MEAPATSARYIAIAVDVAARIAREEYREGQKILGRSSLAGRYNVSPETIRRALSLLEEMGIVHVLPGVGVVIKSKLAAESYLTQVGQHQALQEIQDRLSALLREKNKLDAQIAQLMDELLNYTFKMATRLQKIYEVKIPSTSPLAGKTLADSEFRAKTGATVLAVERQGETTYSPPAHMEIRSGDLLVVIGPQEEKDQVYALVDHP